MLRKALFGGVHAGNQRPLFGLAAELVFRSRGNPQVQRAQIDVENEHLVEQMDEALGVSRAATEEGLRAASIGDQGSDLVDVPDPAPVPPPEAVRHALRRRKPLRSSSS